MSTVNIVALELKIALRDDIKAANITAISKPRTPVGIRLLTNLMKAMFVHPYLLRDTKWMQYDKEKGSVPENASNFD